MEINPRSFLFPLFPLFFPLFLFGILLLTSPASSSVYDPWFLNCQDSFKCDGILDKEFPPWRYNGTEFCGGYPEMKIKCHGIRPTIEIARANFELLGFSISDQILIIAEIGFSDGFCSPEKNISSSSMYAIIPVSYDCGLPQPDKKPTCHVSFENLNWPNSSYCWLSAVVPISRGSLKQGDDLRMVAHHIIEKFKSGRAVVDSGACNNCNPGSIYVYDLQLSQTRCCCQSSFDRIKLCASSSVTQSPNYADEPKTALPSDDSKKSKKEKVKPLIIGVSIGGACLAATIIGCCIFLCFRKKKKQYPIGSVSKEEAGPSPHVSDSISNKDLPPAPLLNSFQSQSIPSYPSSKSDIVTPTTTNHGIRVFNYAELETATNKFDRSRELGDGGFGTVYYGKLVDGREVAVKRLYEHNCKRVEQFMNEVDILAHLQHDNLVKLYGCTSRYSQGLLLVYEYIPNGTVADHLHGSRMKLGLLSWPIRLRIAIETANALMYLHHSEIIHRDVKTTNILLDNNFTVKVADFGLSRLFPTDVTHVSTAPQGTPGYVDPEYYQCYQLTTKSDVYSFGVVLIELISSLRAVDTDRTRHDINLSNMAISKIRSQALDELVDPKLGFNKNHEVRSATTSVAELAFLCLQQERDLRPTMDEVVEVLRKIENEKSNSEMAKVIDIGVVGDDIKLIKKAPPSFSPNSVIANNWVSSSTTTDSL